MNVESILVELRSERDRLDQAISALEGVSTNGARRGRPPLNGTRGRRHMSASARHRIGIAMRKRWAERKAASSAPKPAAKKARKGHMSPAARKRMSLMMKKRWAERRKQQS